jgi:uncharacterized protein YdhG (YjbR/CyaY superfamily)
MQSSAKNVTEYLKELPAERRTAISKLRALCRRQLAGFKESMEYGMPCYKRKDVIEVGFASQKQYVSIYVLKTKVLNKYRTKLKPASIGKGCIRYRKPEQIDFGLIEAMLAESAASDDEIC